MARQAGDDGGGRIIPRPAPPGTPAELLVAGLWQELLDAGDVGPHDDFFARGGDSFRALRLVEALERRVGLRLPLSAFLDDATLGGLARALVRSGGGPLACFRPGRDGGAPLALLHPAGGSALCYLELARRLPWRHALHGLSEPADGRAPTLEARASRYVDLLRDARPEAAWSLGGHSFGGLVAFEAARQLAARGRRPPLVLLIDAGPPGHDGRRDEDAFVRGLADRLLAADVDSGDPAAEERLLASLAELADATPRADGDARGRTRFGALESFCRRLRFVPDGALGYAELRAFLGSLRSAFEQARRYTPGAYDGRVVLLQAQRSDAGWRRVQAERWRALAPALEVRPVPGGHLDLLGEPHVEALAAQVSGLLDEGPA